MPPDGEGAMRRRMMLATGAVLAASATMAASASVYAQPSAPHPRSAATIDPNIHKIKHVIVIMQENRSFDSYFGTFPGADGIPKGVCLPDPRNGGCRKPFVDHRDSNGNDPHAETPFSADVDGGKMDGFVSIAEKKLCKPKPAPCHPDVMGYHVGTDIPNYWAYARNFVLQAHFFEAPGSWSLPAHLYEVSAWSAKCTKTGDPMSCKATGMPPERTPGDETPFAWTDVTWLLHRRAQGQPARQPAPAERLLQAGQGREPAAGVVGRAGLQGQRARPGPDQHRAGLRHQGDQRGHAQPGLGLHGHFPDLGRLGRLLRQRAAAVRG